MLGPVCLAAASKASKTRAVPTVHAAFATDCSSAHVGHIVGSDWSICLWLWHCNLICRQMAARLLTGCQPAQQPACADRLIPRLPAGPLIQPGRSNHLARKELQYHLYQHQQLLHGYTDFVARHTHQLLSLVLRKPPAPGSSLHHVLVTAAEFEQLGLLLRSSGTEEPSASQQGGSPMDIGPASPFLGGHLVQGVLG